MKKLITLFIAVIFATVMMAQTPQKMSYQAVVRNAAGELVSSQSVGMKISILQGSPGGKLVYQEIYNPYPQTNANGLVSLEIGEGKPVNGDFSTIDWSNGPYYLMTETDPSADGGTNYTISGTSQLLSVPYALYANSAAEFTGTITETQGLSDVIAIDNVANAQIKAVSDPTEPQDAATKAYVDLLKEQVLTLQAEIGVSDKDGNHYNAVKIGTQVWMAENLKTTKYNDGTSIDLVTDDAAWVALSTPGYCWYNNDKTTYGDTYGAMYNWYTVATGKLCPAGWHVPSDAEWTVLTDYLINNGYGFEGSGDDIGKSVASVSGWMTDPTAGNVGNDPTSNNSSGFNAPPGGFRGYNGPFYGLGSNGHCFSSTESNVTSAWRRSLNYNENIFKRSYYDKTCGFYVRCIKD